MRSPFGKAAAVSALALVLSAPAVSAEIDNEELRGLAEALFEPIPEGPIAINGEVPTDEQIELGKMLFFETRLSRGHNISCNTCHNLGTGGADLARVSLGHRWQQGGRNSPTVLNAVFNTAQFWDGRAADLAEQAGGPLVNPVEMASTEPHVLETLRSMPGYLPYFEAAFPDDPDPVSFENTTYAIAAFEATLVTPNSPFDRFMAGDDDAMSDLEKEGFETFINSGCASCHDGINLGGNSYEPFGVVEKPGWSVRPVRGHAFRG